MRPVYASDVYALGVTCMYLMSGKSTKEHGLRPNYGRYRLVLSTFKVSDSFCRNFDYDVRGGS